MGPGQKLEKRFWSEPYDLNTSNLEEKNVALSKLIDRVSLIKRLREVRVLKSFTRFYTSKEIAVCNPSEPGACALVTCTGSHWRRNFYKFQ